MSQTEPKALLSPDEFRRKLGLGRATTYEFLRVGKIKSIKIGRKILVPASEVQGFVEREAA